MTKVYQDDRAELDGVSEGSVERDTGNEASHHASDMLTAASIREQFNHDLEEFSQSGSDDESAMLKATQRNEKVNRRQMDNMAAEGGVIESVTCINFMCHSKLHVVLGPLINFIIGHNGSGKSAVLSAITLCLGGKATSTNRGQNLKSFIKEGTE